MRENGKLENVHFVKSLEPEVFIKILSNSACIIGNSSVGVRECSFLGVPAVDIGTRQVNRVTGENVIHVDFDYEEIRRAVKELWGRRFRRSTIYGDGNAAFRILECLKKTL
jgi:UDP-N-acetylglucosamine 2-epimerase